MGVEVVVGTGAGVILLVLKSPVLVVKAERHQKQDRDMCPEALPDPHLAPKAAAVAIQNLGWILMDVHDERIQIFMFHHINITCFALKHPAFSKYPVGLLAAPTASRRMVNLLLI